MKQLKPDTWYYAYTDEDEKEIFISEDAPTRNSKLMCWLHPKLNNLKIAGVPFRFETKSSDLKGFYGEHKITG